MQIRWPWTREPEGVDPVAVVLHDGARWILSAFAFSGDNFQLLETREFPSTGTKSLPDDMLELCESLGSRRLRVFEFADVHQIDLHLPTDATADEIQAGLAFEVAPTLKMTADEIRVAAVRASTFRMGGDPDQFLASGFDGRAIDRYEQGCALFGLRFEGMGALEMALLSHHARQAPEKSMLLVRENAMFAVVPGGDGAAFYVRNLPQGAHQAVSDPEQWSSRLEQRLPSMRGRDVVLIRADGAGVVTPEIIADVLHCTVTEVQDLATVAGVMARHAAWGHVGVIDSGCATVSQAEPETDWDGLRRRATLVTAVASLLLALVVWQVLGSRHDDLTTELASRQGRVTERTDLSRELGREQRLKQALGDENRVDGTALMILTELPRLIGPWSRIRSIESANDRIVIRGETIRPDELSAFYRALDQRAASRGCRVEERGLEHGRQAGMLTFTYHIVRDGSR